MTRIINVNSPARHLFLPLSTACLEDLAQNITDQFFDGQRQIYTTFYYDTSGSMTKHEQTLCESAKKVLEALAKHNASGEDGEFLVRIVTFNNDVHVLNQEFLPPEQLLELIDNSTFRCGGGTNLTAIVNQIDSDCSRQGVAFANKHSSDFQPFSILVTDFMGTDSDASREAAMNRLLQNQLYVKKSQALCVFVGPESQKCHVEALAGGADRVIALGSDLERYLTPVVLGSTINMNQSTHLSIDSASSIAEQSVRRVADGQQSAEEIQRNQEALNEELRKLLGGESQCAF